MWMGIWERHLDQWMCLRGACLDILKPLVGWGCPSQELCNGLDGTHSTFLDSANIRIDIWRICKDTFWLYCINVTGKRLLIFMEFQDINHNAKKKGATVENQAIGWIFCPAERCCWQKWKTSGNFIFQLCDELFYYPSNYIWQSKINMDHINH